MTRRRKFAWALAPRLSRLTPEPLREQPDAAKQKGRFESTKPPEFAPVEHTERRGAISSRRACSVDQIRLRRCRQSIQVREMCESPMSTVQASSGWDTRVQNTLQGTAHD